MKPLFLNKYSVVKANDYAKDWIFMELGNLDSGIFSNGINKNKEDYGDGCLFVNISDVFREFTINPKKLKRVKVTGDEIEQYKLKKDDLVLDRSSNIFETVGYPVYFDGANEPVVFSGFTFRYRPNSKTWNSKFLTFQLMSYSIRKLIISISTKSANSNVNQNSYKKINIPAPPTQEQTKIASILSNVDSLIESTDIIIEKTERLKKGLMQQLLTKGIGHTKFKKVKWYFGKEIEIPEGWEVLTLKEKSLITDGSHFSPPKVNKGFPMATVENIRDSDLNIKSCYQISKENFEQLIKNNCKPKINDVLFTKDGTVGKSLVFIHNADVVVLSSIAILSPLENLNSYYLHYSLHSEAMSKFIAKYLGGTAIKRIVLKNLGKFIFPFPPLPEQKQIASILSGIDAHIQKNQEYKENLETLKKGLMQKLLTGQIRV